MRLHRPADSETPLQPAGQVSGQADEFGGIAHLAPDEDERGSREDKNYGTCVVVRPGGAQAGAQRFDYFEGVSAQSAGARGICMHLLTMPPCAAARPHLHEDHETAIYVLSGRARMRYGERLVEELEVKTGEFLYIPAGMPHLPYNASDAEACTALLARTDPNEQESVVLLDAAGRRP
jgi:uncharacterized RmlC-like cupin family protein